MRLRLPRPRASLERGSRAGAVEQRYHWGRPSVCFPALSYLACYTGAAAPLTITSVLPLNQAKGDDNLKGGQRGGQRLLQLPGLPSERRKAVAAPRLPPLAHWSQLCLRLLAASGAGKASLLAF